ncbi:MAG: glycosyltransferase 87 family protein [Candidatus Kapabacteria bacterium]|nr:glycosyltransferase 87 family protein [Candidatus Kapabacteria bacterium]
MPFASHWPTLALVAISWMVLLASDGASAVAWALSSAGWIAAMAVVLKRRHSHVTTTSLALALLALAAATTMAIVHRPLSDDVLRYMWDGHAVLQGGTPYMPPALSSMKHQTVFDGTIVSLPDAIKYSELPTIYPPGSQLLFTLCSAVAGSSMPLWIATWAAIVGAAAVAAWLLARPSERLLITMVATCPMLLRHGVLDPHVDLPMGLLVLLSALLLRRCNDSRAGVLLGCSVAIKYASIVAVPLLVWQLPKHRVLKIGAGFVVAVVACTAPFLMSRNIVGSLGAFVATFQSNSLVGHVLLTSGIAVPTARMVMALAMAAAGMAVLWRFRQDPFRALAVASAATLCLSPVAHPWYMALPVVLFPLAPTRSALALTISMAAYHVAWSAYSNGGVWEETTAVLMCEWIPVMACVVWDVRAPWSLSDEVPGA